MTRAPKPAGPVVETAPLVADADGDEIVQVKVWLRGVSPMVWRRLLVRSTCTLRELHGVIQVAMGWEGIHLYQFCLRSGRYGSSELSASSPEVTVAALRLRKGARFTYEYDLNIPWRHEIRIENGWRRRWVRPPCLHWRRWRLSSGGLRWAGRLHGRKQCRLSIDGLEDLDTMAEIIGEVVLERWMELLDDEDTRWRLEQAVERSKARERAQGQPFSRREVNARFRKGEHLELMCQQY